MKTPSNLRLALTLVTTALTLVAASSALANLKGAERLQALTRPSTETRSAARHSTGTPVRSCDSCVTVARTETTMDKGRPLTQVSARHLCGSCQTSLDTHGHGKAKTTSASHSCSNNSQASKTCCAAPASAGVAHGTEKN